MKFISMELSESGDLAIQYMLPADQSQTVQEVRTIYVNLEMIQEWEHASYYYVELMQDVDEFLGWVDKYRKGTAT